MNEPKKPGNLSNSTLSLLTQNLLLLCFLGVFIIGIVSLGPAPEVLILLIGPAFGGVPPGELNKLFDWRGETGGDCEFDVVKGIGEDLEGLEEGWCGAEEGCGSGSCGIRAFRVEKGEIS